MGDNSNHRFTPRRVLTREEAIAYAAGGGYDDPKTAERRFMRLVANGSLPRPLRGTKTWDLKAIDAALDRMSELSTQKQPLTPYAAWKERQHANASQGRAEGENASR